MGGEGARRRRRCAALEEVLAARRGTAPAAGARDADELAVLLDRAGDLTARRAAGARRADRGAARRAVGGCCSWPRDPVPIARAWPASGGAGLARDPDRDYGALRGGVWCDACARSAAAWARPRRRGAEVVPERCARRSLTRGRRGASARAVRRARRSGDGGDVARALRLLPPAWVERRLEEWERSGQPRARHFGGGATAASGARAGCSSRRGGASWRRLRKQIEAVGSRGLRRVSSSAGSTSTPATRLEGRSGRRRDRGAAVRARAAGGGMGARLSPGARDGYDPAWLARLGGAGELVWAGEGTARRERRTTLRDPLLRARRRGALARHDVGRRALASRAARARGARAAGAIVHRRPAGGDRARAAARCATRCASWWRRGWSRTTRSRRCATCCARSRCPHRAARDEPDPTRWLPAASADAGGRSCSGG